MNPVYRRPALLCAILLGLGLIFLQAFIGGRVLLFGLPGFAFCAVVALLSLGLIRERRLYADVICLGATALFCGYLLVRAAVTPGYYARLDLFSIAGALVVYSITATVITSARARLAVIAILLAFALVQVGVGAVQFTRGDNFMLIPFLQRADYGPRASGFLVCPNHLAGFLEVVGIFGIALTCWGRWPLWGKLLAGYSTGICYIGLALTGSRGGYLSALASLLFFAVCSLLLLRSSSPGRWRRLAAYGVAAVLLVTVAGAALIQQNAFLSSRASNIIDSKNVRMTLWRAAVKQWQLQPIVGTGAGTYRFYGREFRTEEMQNDPIDVHNDYLHLLCEYGLIGAAAFAVFFAAHARHGWRSFSWLAKGTEGRGAKLSNRLALALGAWSAIAAYVVHSAVDFNLHIPANALLLAFVFGVVANPALSGRPAQAPRRIVFSVKWATGAVAVLLLISAARLAPGEYYTERSRVALRDEKPGESVRLAHIALRYDKRNPENLFYLGRGLLALAHSTESLPKQHAFYEEAVAAFHAARQVAPLDGSYALNLAFAYDEMRRYDEADLMYNAARHRDPRSLAVSELYKAHLKQREQSDRPRDGSM